MAEYERRKKEEKPVVAICYDFDKTLSPDDMQAQGYIQSVGDDVEGFWQTSNQMAAGNDMDQNLAYMYLMKTKANGKVLFTKSKLKEYGAKVTLFPGVEEWFSRIRKYGEEAGVIVEHYIISSGLKEMIEGTSIGSAGVFENIYASSFYYDPDGVAVWPAQVVNYTNKTQFLFRIEKGTLDVNDPAVNASFEPEEIRVPFRNMIYIGDSDTDIPCMKLVTAYGGHSVAVFKENKTKAYQMMRDGRVRYFAPADYSEGTPLDTIVKTIITRTAANEALESLFYECKGEQAEADRNSSEEERRKRELLNALEDSYSFANTHAIVKKLGKIKDWTPEEKRRLFAAALENWQVKGLLGDCDVKRFYESLLPGWDAISEEAREVMAIWKNNDGKRVSCTDGGDQQMR